MCPQPEPVAAHLAYQRMLASNYSWGFEKDPKTLESNDHLHTKWTNPLEIRLPNAPSMKMYCCECRCLSLDEAFDPAWRLASEGHDLEFHS